MLPIRFPSPRAVAKAAREATPIAKEPSVKLTAESIAAIAADKDDKIIWDDDMPGFGVRARGGAKRYVAQYRVGTKQRRESLGDVRKIVASVTPRSRYWKKCRRPGT